MSATYLISDLHLGHANVIDYCDRPFPDVETMNRALVDSWNAVVDPDDEVVFAGDLTISGSAADFLRWTDTLNGEIVFLVGNHDRTVMRTLDDVHVMDHYRFEHGGYRFYCTHFPENLPTNFDGWGIYGHHHNNHPAEFPFLDPERRRVNVSVELIGYEPLAVETLVDLLDRGERLVRLPDRSGK